MNINQIVERLRKAKEKGVVSLKIDTEQPQYLDLRQLALASGLPWALKMAGSSAGHTYREFMSCINPPWLITCAMIESGYAASVFLKLVEGFKGQKGVMIETKTAVIAKHEILKSCSEWFPMEPDYIEIGRNVFSF